jgi:ubiquinone/menaquinone biosynthesis C-methylase UbiE
MSDLFDYDAELRLHNEHLRAAARVGPRDCVLDIGCGTGQSTRDAAHAAVSGSAVGVDVSAPMLERARQLSDEQGLANISYQLADAQVHRFPPTRFDLCISRFGTMFFAPSRRVHQHRARSAPRGTPGAAGLARARPQ